MIFPSLLLGMVIALVSESGVVRVPVPFDKNDKFDRRDLTKLTHRAGEIA